MNEKSQVSLQQALAYAYRPSVLGAAYEFRLSEQGLDWNVGRKSGRVAWRSVRRVRMSFRPASMQPHRFVTEIWAEGAPKLEIMSTSWKSMIEQERLDKDYAAFVTELHRRLVQAAAPARYEQGTNPALYWPGLIVFVAVALGLAALIAHALAVHATGGAAFIAVFLALFLWRGGEFFRRNRPGRYQADALPAELMPKG
jgi:hypothetical protein